MGGFAKLTPHNYATWRDNVKEPLVEKGLLRYVNGTAKKPANTANEERKEDWETKQEMALGTLFKHISDTGCANPYKHFDKIRT